MKNYNSPFKMKPGRGNNPKTGHGMPSQLMSGSPLKQTDEGIERDPVSSGWQARPYEKRIVETETAYHVVGGDNKTIESAKKSDKKASEALRRKYQGNLAENQFRRTRNATTQNAIEKTTTNRPAEQAVQSRLKKVEYDRTGQATRVYGGHARKSKMVQERDRNRTRM